MSEARFSHETEKVRNTVAEVREPSAKYLVKSGYTQTEIGMFPRQWEVKTLSELGVFSKGLGIKKNEATSGNLPCIRYGEIYTHHNDVIRIYNSFISSDVAASSKRLKKGDILFAGSGETKEEIGKAVAFLGEDEVYAGGDIVIFTPKRGVPTFLGYLLNSPAIVKQKSSKGQGDAVVHISATALGSVLIALPTVDEQHAIAKALSDVDALIAGLEKLIAKKRDIKQATMQQLLTGQTRLPGFSGEWAVKRLGELANVAKGRGLSKGQIADSGANLCILYGELFTTYERVITSVVSKTNSTEGLLGRRGDVLLPGSTTTKGIDLAVACALLADDVQLGGDINVVRMKSASVYDPIFMANLLTHTQKLAIADLAQGSTIIHLYGRNLLNLMLKLPVITEQTAIATALSDMDTEITAIEFRLAKTRDLKQGMMQELLTGRTRLV